MKFPEVLKTLSGVSVTDKEIWERFRRNEIIDLFSNYIYGICPVKSLKDLSFKSVELKSPDPDVIFKKITISFLDYSFEALEFLPKKTDKPLPAFLYIMYEAENEEFNPSEDLNCDFLPISELIKKGYAVFVLPTKGIAPDFDHNSDYKEGVFKVFTPVRTDRTPSSWATISAWA